MNNIEYGKADLVNGFVKDDQINLLQGKNTYFTTPAKDNTVNYRGEIGEILDRDFTIMFVGNFENSADSRDLIRFGNSASYLEDKSLSVWSGGNANAQNILSALIFGQPTPELLEQNALKPNKTFKPSSQPFITIHRQGTLAYVCANGVKLREITHDRVLEISNLLTISNAKKFSLFRKFNYDIGLDGHKQYYNGGRWWDVLNLKSDTSTTPEGLLKSLCYGIQEDLSLSTSACTRIGNLELHKTLPIQNGIYTCVLRQDGTEAYKLNPNNWNQKIDGTQSDLTGADGYVMTYIPPYYAKEFTNVDGNANKKNYYFSQYAIDGFIQLGDCYISAYEATVDRTTNTLVSVKSNDVKYRGGNNNASLDGLDTTQIGMCATAINSINHLAYARKNGTNWVNYDEYSHISMAWLIYLEFANFNNQLAVNNALTTEGYRQGGLGAGVTTVNSSKWSAFNEQYPLVKIGASDQLGNGTGEVTYTLPASFDAAEVKVSVPRYRGIENPFGHVWKWTSGILFDMGTEESKMYICNDPSKYGTGGTITSDYQFVGLLSRISGYIKEFIGGFHIQPKQVDGGAGSSTYKCDYFYTNANMSQGVRGLPLGGSSVSSTHAGCGCSDASSAPALTYAHVGSRLCLRKPFNNDRVKYGCTDEFLPQSFLPTLALNTATPGRNLIANNPDKITHSTDPYISETLVRTTVPNEVPDAEGQIWINSTNNVKYISLDTQLTSDWKQLK